jgi:Putative Ig domain
MTLPVWITPAGFLGTVTEKVRTLTYVSASGDNVSYSIINGSLPGGLRFSDTGAISGTPYSVGQITTSQFVVRAINPSGVTDRTFVLYTLGPTDPIWLTPGGFLPIGINSQYYVINKQFVDYQLSAEYDKLPPGQKLRYYIADQDGTLPPGLELTEDGRIVGQISDKLKLTYKASSSGGYDLEAYDDYPYDHVTVAGTQLGLSAKFIAKTYQFNVSVTDGVSTSKRLFRIKVEDPSSLRVDTTYISIDTDKYLSDAGYLLSPQWLTPANLGVVRTNNNQVIKLNVYDFNPFYGPTRYDWNTPTVNQDGTPSVHPPGFQLDTSSGVLHAKLPYQPAYSEIYKFTIWVIKTDLQNGDESVTARTFTMTVRGDVEASIVWISSYKIGSIAPGYLSELSVVAQHLGNDYRIQYELIGGKLPPGLTLFKDGSITGKVAYDSTTRFENGFSIDGGSTTIDKRIYFTVRASDIYLTSAIEQEFYIEVLDSDGKKYTKIYAEPLLLESQRSKYTEFITDAYTFNRSLLYRVDDPNFGLQEKIRLYIEHGIEQARLGNYYYAMSEYFYRKRFLFGNVKYSKANDPTGNYVYDIVYIEIIDSLENNKGESLTGAFTTKNYDGTNLTVHPNSVANMKEALEGIKISGTSINTDEYLMPRYMRTIQAETGSPLGFILAVPLCYALPGNGDTIIKRIAASGFNFNSIDFDVDRLVIESSLSNSDTKYLLFPRKDITGINPGDALSYIVLPENKLPLLTEDGLPLQLEL